jgi:hypothetical protein
LRGLQKELREEKKEERRRRGEAKVVRDGSKFLVEWMNTAGSPLIGHVIAGMAYHHMMAPNVGERFTHTHQISLLSHYEYTKKVR